MNINLYDMETKSGSHCKTTISSYPRGGRWTGMRTWEVRRQLRSPEIKTYSKDSEKM